MLTSIKTIRVSTPKGMGRRVDYGQRTAVNLISGWSGVLLRAAPMRLLVFFAPVALIELLLKECHNGVLSREKTVWRLFRFLSVALTEVSR